MGLTALNPVLGDLTFHSDGALDLTGPTTTTRVTKFAKDPCHGHTSRLAAKPAVANGYIASDTEFSKMPKRA